VLLDAASARLGHDLEVVRAFTAGVSDTQARWRPTADAWSLVEVVNHLVDEEVLDFRTRVELALFSPDVPFTPIDPPAWVVAHRYAERELGESVARFTAERQRSLAWLAGLDDPDWTRRHAAPWGGTIAAGDLLASWVAHDHLHVRQLDELHYGYLASSSAPFSVAYAGDW